MKQLTFLQVSSLFFLILCVFCTSAFADTLPPSSATLTPGVGLTPATGSVTQAAAIATGTTTPVSTTPTMVMTPTATMTPTPVPMSVVLAAQLPFHMPYGVAVDSKGNIEIADTLNHRIRQIAPDGGVTTLAGSFGRDAADGENATFDLPAGIVLDASGNLYVADSGDDMIRKMNRADQVSSLAGQAGVTGASNGRGSDALFNNPWGVAVDSTGNVYVADMANNMIRKIDPKGEVTTLAGGTTPGSADGTGTSASFNHPMGVAVDSTGNVYVADTANHLIRKITPKGEVTTLAGGGKGSAANGLGVAASFNWPTGIAVDAKGNIYVADSANLMIRKITPLGQVSTFAGPKITGTDYGLGNNTVNPKTKFQPYGVAVDASGNVYAVDPFNNLIRKIDQN